MTDVRERHQRGEEPPGEFWCTECLYYPSGSYDTDHVPWPCDAIQQADRADKAEAAFEAMDEHFMKARDIARELAEALRDAIEVVHQTDSLRSHADPSDRTGWNRHGIETCEDATCAEGLDLLARFDAEYGR